MTKFLNKLKNPVLGPFLVHFPNFPDNPALSSTASYGFLAPCQKLEKTDGIIPRNHSDRRKDGRKNRQTLFYRTLPVNAWCSTNASNQENWFRINDTKYQKNCN